MSKFTDFYPAASGVGFPFTGSAGMTGSLNTEVLGVEGGVAFSYNNVGTTRGWSTNSYSLPLSVGQRNASIGGINNSVIIGGTSNPTSTQLFDGIAATSTTAFPYVARDKRGAGTATDAVFAGGSAYVPNAGPSKNNTNTWNGATYSAVANLPTLVGGQGMAGVSSISAIAAGGFPAIPGGASTNVTYLWDGTANTWSTPGFNMANNRSFFGMAGTDSSAIAAAGNPSLASNPAKISAAEEWNGTSWNAITPLPAGERSFGNTGTTSNFIMFSGGVNTTITQTWNGTTWDTLSPTYSSPVAVASAGVGNADQAQAYSNQGIFEWQNFTTVAGQYETFNYSEQTGVTTVSNLVETSAERYKKDIQPLDNQLDKVKQLNPVQYTWKRDNKQDIGFIAEEVQNIYPELVKHNEEGEIEGMNYNHLASALVKSMQEQQAQLDTLKNKLNDLDNE